MMQNKLSFSKNCGASCYSVGGMLFIRSIRPNIVGTMNSLDPNSCVWCTSHLIVMLQLNLC